MGIWEQHHVEVAESVLAAVSSVGENDSGDNLGSVEFDSPPLLGSIVGVVE